MDIDIAAIFDSVVQVCQEEAMGRFHSTAAPRIWSKSSGEVVTEVDWAIERRLSSVLRVALPGSVVVGEEGVSARPEILRVLDSARLAWIIDPLDGTAGFVRGEPDFATMVALLIAGEAKAAIIVATAMGRYAWGGCGYNVTIGELPRRLGGELPHGNRIVVTNREFQTPEDRAQISRLAASSFEVTPCRSVGVAYLDLLAGRFDGGLFGWNKIWDHAAGVFLFTENGGTVLCGDGKPFKPSHQNRTPIVAATNPHNAYRILRTATAL